MTRRAASFTEADAKRALAAALKVSPGPWRLRIVPGGEIIVEPAAPVEPVEIEPTETALAFGLSDAP